LDPPRRTDPLKIRASDEHRTLTTQQPDKLGWFSDGPAGFAGFIVPGTKDGTPEGGGDTGSAR
jgi:hypothetical protein